MLDEFKQSNNITHTKITSNTNFTSKGKVIETVTETRGMKDNVEFHNVETTIDRYLKPKAIICMEKRLRTIFTFIGFLILIIGISLMIVFDKDSSIKNIGLIMVIIGPIICFFSIFVIKFKYTREC